MLEVSGLRAGYARAEALHGIDLKIAPGECVGLLGLNGAGKSTLLATILGLNKTWAGTIEFGGRRIDKWPTHRRIEAGLGLVHESRELFSSLTVEQNLRTATSAAGDGRQAQTNMKRALTLFPDLRSRMSQIAGTLSGGEQQMLAVGRALVAQPRLLMLDEPSLGLAPMVVDNIYTALEALRSNDLSMLIVEQHVAKIAGICDRLYVVDSGEVIFEGTTDALDGRLDIRSIYLGDDDI
jgi:branched-chain amino acid transport system ATP-binding protein